MSDFVTRAEYDSFVTEVRLKLSKSEVDNAVRNAAISFLRWAIPIMLTVVAIVVTVLG